MKPIGAESVLPRFAAESQRASVCGNVLAAAAVLAPEIVQGPILWHQVASQRILSMAPGVAIKALSVGLIGVTGERGGGSKVKGKSSKLIESQSSLRLLVHYSSEPYGKS